MIYVISKFYFSHPMKMMGEKAGQTIEIKTKNRSFSKDRETVFFLNKTGMIKLH